MVHRNSALNWYFCKICKGSVDHGNDREIVANICRKLEGIKSGEEDVVDIIYDENHEADALDIDKAWHAIHFILNGSAWEGELPLFNTILGGAELGEDLGVGPVRYLTDEEVKCVALSLSNLSEQELKSRFDPDMMNALEIYPALDWNRQDEPEYVFAYLEQVIDYYLDASRKNNAMLLYIS